MKVDVCDCIICKQPSNKNPFILSTADGCRNCIFWFVKRNQKNFVDLQQAKSLFCKLLLASRICFNVF